MEVVDWWDITILKSDPNNRHISFISHLVSFNPIHRSPSPFISHLYPILPNNLIHKSPWIIPFHITNYRHWKSSKLRQHSVEFPTPHSPLSVPNELHRLRRLIPHQCATSSEALATPWVLGRGRWKWMEMVFFGGLGKLKSLRFGRLVVISDSNWFFRGLELIWRGSKRYRSKTLPRFYSKNLTPGVFLPGSDTRLPLRIDKSPVSHMFPYFPHENYNFWDLFEWNPNSIQHAPFTSPLIVADVLDSA